MKKIYVVTAAVLSSHAVHAAPANKSTKKIGAKPPISIERKAGTTWYDTFGRTPTVWAGENIKLQRRRTVPTYDGNYQGDWMITGREASEYKVDSNTIELNTDVQKSMQDVEFFWADAGKFQVSTLVAHSNRPRSTVSAIFSVKKPSVTVTSEIGVAHWNQNADWKTNNISMGDDSQRYRLYEKGVYPSIDGPRAIVIMAKKGSGFPAGGSLNWIQINTETQIKLGDDPMGSQSRLDNGDRIDTPFYPHPTDVAGYDAAMEDVPASAPRRNLFNTDYSDFSIFRRDHFTTWLMFRKDSNSAWVPLKSVDWFWQARATHPQHTNPVTTGRGPNDWVVTEAGQNARPAEDTNQFPKWPQ